MFAGAQGLDRQLGVEFIRRHDRHRISNREEFLHVRDGTRDAVAVGKVLRPLCIDVVARRERYAAQGLEAFGVTVRHLTGADDADANSLHVRCYPSGGSRSGDLSTGTLGLWLIEGQAAPSGRAQWTALRRTSWTCG